MPPPTPLSPHEFDQRFRALLAAHAETTENIGCIACDQCTRCTDSTFLRGCTNVSRSHYCVRCEDCTECSHCKDSSACVGCTHCEHCERCTQSAYLVKCVGVSGSTYCFGCVGLVKKDFYILNQPYDRQAWFDEVGRMRKALRI